MSNPKSCTKGSFKYRLNFNIVTDCQQLLEEKREIVIQCVKEDKNNLINLWGEVIDKTTKTGGSLLYTGTQNIKTNVITLNLQSLLGSKLKEEIIYLTPLGNRLWEVQGVGGDGNTYNSIAKFYPSSN